MAIATYILWWEKPVNVKESIEMAREKTGSHSQESIIYVESLRTRLNNAEAAIAPLIDLLRSMPWVETVEFKDKPRSDINNHQEIVAALAVLRSINECPDEADQQFKAIPIAIKQYFARAVRRDDVKWAILHHIRMLPEIPR